MVIDTTAGNVIVTLPAIATRRLRPVTVVNSANANNAVVTPAGGETVLNGATRNVAANSSLTFMGPRTGTNWVSAS